MLSNPRANALALTYRMAIDWVKANCRHQQIIQNKCIACCIHVEADPEPKRLTQAVHAKRKAAGVCTQCGSAGTWIAMALVCHEHGRILG